jgi:hypothetical protein
MSDIGIRIGAAGTQAALVLEGAWRAIADGKATVDQISEIYADLTANFVQTMNDLETSVGLVQAFPGTTVASPQETQAFQQAAAAAPNPFASAAGAFAQAAPQAAPGPFDNVAQFPQQPQVAFQQAVQAPAAAPGVGHKDDAAWAKLFQNPGGFYDNRTSKKTPASPDFREKQGDTALWLNGKFGPAPQWVFDRLQGGFGPFQ